MDKYLQRMRIKAASRYIQTGSSVLDIGCHQGELFRALVQKLQYGWEIDPLLQQEVNNKRLYLVKGIFPVDLKMTANVDCIYMLAVPEHIPYLLQEQIARKCSELLMHDGLIIITVPSPKTEILLNILKSFRFNKGMSLEEHYGFDPKLIPVIFGEAGFNLVLHRKFQLGFNNIFLFRKKN